MNRQEFEWLRDLPSKRIDEDILYAQKAKGIRVYEFRVQIVVDNRPEIVLSLDGTYNWTTDNTKFNVTLKGVGPICRVDVNGRNHRDQGRTHKHSLHTENCPRNNLPIAVARPDLENLTSRQVFEDFCERANITFNGVFHDP